MNIAASELQSMLSINRSHPADAGICRNDPVGGASSENAENLAEECADVIENIIRDGETTLAKLERSVENMQERLLDELRPRLSGIGVNLDERIALSLTEDGALLMEGAFSGVEDMEKVAGISREFSGRFRALASRAALMHGLERACGILRAARADDEENGPRYKACLKGRLSHFYIG